MNPLALTLLSASLLASACSHASPGGRTHASIYARESTPEEQKRQVEKSGTRQKQEARAYAVKCGWIVADVHADEDDGISSTLGVAHRPGLKALLEAAESTPRPFDVVVMAADDRLMRN